MHHEYIEYAGFVANIKTGQYEALFITEISALLARNRAIETAKNANKNLDYPYDIGDVSVKQRTVKANYGEWQLI